MIRILVVDDQALVRAGLQMIFQPEDDLEIVGEAADGTSALAAALQLRPDVILMDVRMPDMNGIEATRRLVAEGFEGKVLMLTTFDLDEYVYEALHAGAGGFLLKDIPPEQLVAGVRSVVAGEALFAPAITQRMIEAFMRTGSELHQTTPSEPELAELTEREAEVVRHIARGLSNAEISRELFISRATVKAHVAHILSKLQLRDRVQVVIFAYESGLVHPAQTDSPQ